MRVRRERLGLSRERIAGRLEPPVTAKTIERWEKGVSPLPGYRRIQLDVLYNTFEAAAVA
jgi:hypothetical protein